MSRFATDNGNAAAGVGNGEVKELAVPSGMRQMASKKKDELDDKYGGTGGKKVLTTLCLADLRQSVQWTSVQVTRVHVLHETSCSGS